MYCGKLDLRQNDCVLLKNAPQLENTHIYSTHKLTVTGILCLQVTFQYLNPDSLPSFLLMPRYFLVVSTPSLWISKLSLQPWMCPCKENPLLSVDSQGNKQCTLPGVPQPE